MNKMPTVNIIGAGLAGSEACYQLAKRGYNVTLYEMRPHKMTPAHETAFFSELVCSNSLRANSLENAVGILKEEMRLMDSLIIEAALKTQVEAGGALAVDRHLFAEYITSTIKKFTNVTIINEEVTTILDGPTIIATGPLTSDAFLEAIKEFVGSEHLYFFDAVAPIIDAKTINYDKVFLASRYNKGEAAYLNCPMTENEFNDFYSFLINAESVQPADFELKVFEGCMPIEDIAKRGKETLLFGPMKPVGLHHPITNEKYHAIIQLRQDNVAKSLYNIVGFQTHLKWEEQRKMLKYIPGLENASIMRYGVMHRNTYIHAPSCLNNHYQTLKRPNLFMAGQITGVEGYVESAASGLIAGINMAKFLENKPLLDLPTSSASYALVNYITKKHHQFVPMNINFGLFDELSDRVAKKDKKMTYAKRALTMVKQMVNCEFGDIPFTYYDQHLHSDYSVDSSEPLVNYFEKAQRLKIPYVVTTEHIDYPINDRAKWDVDFETLIAELHSLKQKYPKVTPLLGVELGFRKSEIPNQKELLTKYPFDIVLLSFHDDTNIDYYYQEEFSKRGVATLLNEYFKQIYDGLNLSKKQAPDFDVLAHFDYGFKTAHMVDSTIKIADYEVIITKIFKRLIELNKSLEINIKVQEKLPKHHLDYVLNLYRQLGGQLLVLSSDAHQVENYQEKFAKYFEIILSAGFTHLSYYIGRNRYLYRL